MAMSVALSGQPSRTLEEFLDRERSQDVRYEWDGVQPLAMVGGRFAHTDLATRLSDILRPALRGRGTVVRSDLKVMTGRGSRVRYPDLVVTCSPIRPQDQTVPDPVLIAEVLSETTSAVDRGIKRAEYAALPSLRGYLMLAQDRAAALVCDRADSFGERLVTAEAADDFALPGLDIRISLHAIYHGLA